MDKIVWRRGNAVATAYAIPGGFLMNAFYKFETVTEFYKFALQNI